MLIELRLHRGVMFAMERDFGPSVPFQREMFWLAFVLLRLSILLRFTGEAHEHEGY